MWVISNLVASGADFCSSFVKNEGNLTRVMELARNQNSAISMESLWVLTNLVLCGSQDINQVIVNVNEGEIVHLLIDLL